MYSKELSQCDSSFEHPKQMFKKIITILHQIISSPGPMFIHNMCSDEQASASYLFDTAIPWDIHILFVNVFECPL